MNNKTFTAEKITIKSTQLDFYIPPIVWKGDPVGHIGDNDHFFWLLDGTIVLFIENECYIMNAGQLAFLPKGKFRRYTAVSKDVILYTLSFSAKADGVNLMEGLGFTGNNYVVNVDNVQEVTKYFENSSYVCMHNDPFKNIIFNSNTLNILRKFCECSKTKLGLKDERLTPAIEYMKNNLSSNITIEELSALSFMQPTYFIRRFNKIYNSSPMNYLTKLRINKAIELLLTTDTEIEYIINAVGINDVSYFSRWFKKNCGASPTEFRTHFVHKSN